MNSILIDASFYVSLALDTDTNHLKALKMVPKVIDFKVTTEDFIKETLTIISQRKGKRFCTSFYNSILDTEVYPVTTSVFQSGLRIFLGSKLNKDISLIDCIGSVVYKEVGASGILTFDSHFKDLGCKIYH
ncbi:type II toxin-antitoxin system VapC family toxin [Candidatus Gottesmanbacteria bacterium]|nr:type II toxin-antitoxin system VapC family toxin [Candidatus Gottesmanbacteria bacterium]